jgi:two-component system cell cycle response regulator DivK
MSVQPKDATILVVEDNVQNFVLITRLLAYLGVKKCEWKASGWQVLEFAETLPHIDLILMDIFLPEEDTKYWRSCVPTRASRTLSSLL